MPLHLHLPAGSIPKDGPSAGITMAIALISALTKRFVRQDVGMTGEITLRGRVLPVGGIKEKVLVAHRAGIKTFLLPKQNQKDLDEVPQVVLPDLRFVFVEYMDDIINVALCSECKPDAVQMLPTLSQRDEMIQVAPSTQSKSRKTERRSNS